MVMMAPTNGTARRKPLRLPDGVDLGRLCTAIIRDRQDLQPFRRNRRDAVVQLGGKHYSDDGAPVEVPVNLIGLYVQIMSRSLVAQNPRVMYSTFDKSQTAAVDAMQTWANDEIVSMDAVETFKRSIIDALFCLGIIKIALASPSDAAMSAWDDEAGQPFMENIDLDDFFCDMQSRRFDQCSYMGHRYRIPVVVANELYAKGKNDEFTASEREDINDGGDERIETIGRGTGHREEFEDHCDLWEIYLPRHKLVVTLRDAGGIPDEAREPVRIQPWVGPPCGPYHFLSLGLMPGNLMPKAPIMDLIDLHRHYNAAYRKLLRQTRDYKKVLPYRGGQSEEIKRLKDSPDGEIFQCDNAETIKELETGGPANSVLVMSDHMKQSFDFIGGNLALLGGRSPQSRTASQDKMLNQNASAGVADMQDQATSYVQHCMEAMNWYWWNHPTKEMTSQWSPPSLPQFKLNRTVKPQDRRGKMPGIKVDPYSLPRQTPQSRLAFINQVVQTMAPMMALLQQQGVMLDANALLDLFAKYGDEPDIAKIFQFAQPPDTGTAPSQPEQPGMPANTTRTYERYSAGGQGPQEKQANLQADISKMAGPVNPNGGSR